MALAGIRFWFDLRMRRHPFELEWVFPGAQPHLDRDGVDREPYPEGNAEELLGFEMCESAGGEEDAHHGTCRGDAEKNCYGPGQPLLFEVESAASPILPGAKERIEKEAVEEVDCGAL